MPPAPTTDSPNAEQAQYWNGPRGRQWVALQEDLDQRVAPLIDLIVGPAMIAPGHAVLDVGCGTGACLLAVSRMVGRSGQAVGVDIAAPLLEHAAHRLAEGAEENIELLQADAQTHGFAPGRYDAIISRFGVMFFSDPVAAFGNLRRALAPQGRLAFVCWGPLEDNPWFSVPLAVGVARLGPPAPSPPRAPGPLAFSDPDYVREILETAGFEAVTIAPHTTPLIGAATATDEARLTRAVGPLARLIHEHEPAPAIVEEIVAEVAARLDRFVTGDGVRIPAAVFVVSARQRAAG